MEIDRGSSEAKYVQWSEQKPPITFMQSARSMAFTGPLNALLFAAPIALILYGTNASDVATFIFALIALAPLAERLSFVTETLAMHTNDTIGGLLNATFGNAIELIVSITALARGLYRLVQLSLLGSILSNLLLVLGTSLLFGGLKHKTQTFGTLSSQVNSTLLMIVTMSIAFPTSLHNSGRQSALGEIGFSRATSLIMMMLYVAFVYFQIHTHRFLYEGGDEDSAKGQKIENVVENVLIVDNEEQSPTGLSKTGGGFSKTGIDEKDNKTEDKKLNDNEKKEDGAGGDDEEEEEDLLGFNNALIWLGIITLAVSLLSDAISSSIESAADDAGISGVFISAIVLPIVGNASEHAGAVMFGIKNKVDLAIGIAVGSSTQIALFVFPFLVVIGWMMDKDLTLNIGVFEVNTLVLSVISVTFALKEGKSTWIIGLTMICAYFVIACGFWAHDDEDLDTRY